MELSESSGSHQNPLALFKVPVMERFNPPSFPIGFERAGGRPLDLLVAPPAKQGLDFLISAIREQYVIPSITESRTRKQYWDFWQGHLNGFHRAIQALHVFLSHALSEATLGQLGHNHAKQINESLRATLVELAGEDAGAEFDFGVTTMARASVLLSKFASRDPRDERADAKLRRDYAIASALFTVGMYTFIELQRPDTSISTPEVFEKGVMEFFRQGSINAYRAAREAFDLRVAPLANDEGELFTGEPEDVDLAEATIEDVPALATALSAAKSVG